MKEKKLADAHSYFEKNLHTMTSLIDTLRALTKKLPLSPSSRLDVEILLAYVLNIQREDLFSILECKLTSQEQNLLEKLIQRRNKGEPIAYLTGQVEFYGFSFCVNPSVLIPRPETEKLVEQCLKYVKSGDLVLDMGGGSGCVGLSLALLRSDVYVHAIEKCPKALEVLQKNHTVHGSPQNYSFEQCDVMACLQKQTRESLPAYNVVVSNPPYIGYADRNIDPCVKKYEPEKAVFAGPTGFECLDNWSKVAYHLLKSNGHICFEIGFGQAVQAQSLFKKNGFVNTHIIKDDAHLDRIILAKKPISIQKV